MLQYTTPQLSIIESPFDAKTFLHGPAMTGKTTAGVERISYLIENGVPAGSILILVPQRTLAEPYRQALYHPDLPAGGLVTTLTVGGLARRSLETFWPLISEESGFAQPDLPPTFLTMESAQYYMAHIVRPFMREEGYFETVTIKRNRLYSQIIDNLNKAAVVGFPHTELGERLQSAWVGELAQSRVYADAQDCANAFRDFCLEYNLLDFSLQIELFRDLLWPNPTCRRYLTDTYRHLIADNLEEDVPLTHDLLENWLPDFDSALLIADHEAGYRRFLGADPDSARRLRHVCGKEVEFTTPLVSSPAVQAFNAHLTPAIRRELPPPGLPTLDIDSALSIEIRQYYPEMLTWVADKIRSLVEEGTPPGEIVVLAPFLSDALRFSLRELLIAQGIPSRSHRPSRALREEPTTHALLTLAALAHPQWEITPSQSDVTYALLQAIKGLDLIRARLLTKIIYRATQGKPTLSNFERIRPETQERITYQLGNRYQALRDWLYAYRENDPHPLDHFLSRLFGELLSQPGFGFHTDHDQGEITANLIESVQKFRWAVGKTLEAADVPLGKEYLLMVQDGVIAAQYIKRWGAPPDDAVFMAPAYTFLMNNHPVTYQFWLNAGARGWYERIYQPLTHPYILSRDWEQGEIWTDANETEVSLERLQRLASGLLRRCREKVYIGISTLSEQGYEQKGLLLQAVNRVLQER
ncbi:MAG: hypothetical protein MAG431_02100 [Chloroflexi bacterium]|nr:hypothetical protein [Chloroflexota bacterium]